VQVQAVGTPGGRAKFAIEGVVEDVEMEEVQPGVYLGSYPVAPGDTRSDARVVVTFLWQLFTPQRAELPVRITLGRRPPAGG
jgi:hypothetical protein